jgi:hypothetical protein
MPSDGATTWARPALRRAAWYSVAAVAVAWALPLEWGPGYCLALGFAWALVTRWCVAGERRLADRLRAEAAMRGLRVRGARAGCFLAGGLPVLVGVIVHGDSIGRCLVHSSDFLGVFILLVVAAMFLWGVVSGWQKGGPRLSLPAPRPSYPTVRVPSRPAPPLVFPVPTGGKTAPDLPSRPPRIRVIMTDCRCPACRQPLRDGQPTARCTHDANHKVHRHCVTMMQGRCPQCKNLLC